jgi:serine/threonine-protein kinase HipA
MTSELYVWVWLPGHAEPVVCGRVWADGAVHLFRYGRSYLARADAIALYGIPLGEQPIRPPVGMRLHGVLRDALPDAWGQHVIVNRLTGASGRDGDTADLAELVYMRQSASDRFGALDFQDAPDHYVARQEFGTLDDLAEAAAALEEGRPLPPTLAAALTHGTTIGGARPKATLIDEKGDGWIVKFSSASDRGNPVVRHEAVALDLARRAGIQVVEAELITAGGRDALLVRRFDRDAAGGRTLAVSGLTVLELDELMGRHATYPELLDRMRGQVAAPSAVARELFCRIAVNIAVGNTDDHARNHAALWDGSSLVLAPAYDLDPCRTPGWDANQAMAYGRNGERASNFALLIASSATYGLSRVAARSIVDAIVDAVETGWADAVDQAGLTRQQAASLRGTRILNPGIFDRLTP